MRPLLTADQMIEKRATELRTTDPVGYAAWMLRHRGICPQCGGRARTTTENAVTSKRIFGCINCQWTAQVSESQYRGDASKTLRGICEAALEMKKAREGARRAVSRKRRPRRSKDEPRDRTRRRVSVADENPTRDKSTNVQSGSLPASRSGD